MICGILWYSTYVAPQLTLLLLVLLTLHYAPSEVQHHVAHLHSYAMIMVLDFHMMLVWLFICSVFIDFCSLIAGVIYHADCIDVHPVCSSWTLSLWWLVVVSFLIHLSLVLISFGFVPFFFIASTSCSSLSALSLLIEERGGGGGLRLLLFSSIALEGVCRNPYFAGLFCPITIEHSSMVC